MGGQVTAGQNIVVISSHHLTLASSHIKSHIQQRDKGRELGTLGINTRGQRVEVDPCELTISHGIGLYHRSWPLSMSHFSDMSVCQ